MDCVMPPTPTPTNSTDANHVKPVASHTENIAVTQHSHERSTTRSTESGKPLLRVQGLRTYFRTELGLVKAVDGVDFAIAHGETLGVVGESGCGKSVTAMSIMQLLQRPRAEIVGGSIQYYGTGQPIEITELDPKGAMMRSLRGNEIAMIFQEPMSSLNPTYTIGDQIMEAILLHQSVSKAEARNRAIDLLRLVGLSSPEQQIDQYPHQLSGGMRQRVMIAMALSCNPKLLIADEPTTALDVTIEAQILDLMRELQQQFGMSIMLITHSLGVVAEMCEQVIVMYLGKVVERGTTDDIFYQPKHPYTQQLLKSIPIIGLKQRLTPIEGSVPPATVQLPGCPFAPRCPQVMAICREHVPPNVHFERGQEALCWLYDSDVSSAGKDVQYVGNPSAGIPSVGSSPVTTEEEVGHAT
jgi:oligopeptide transport system ATP-binding protein